MKKGLILTASLAMVLGVGAVVSTHLAKSSEAKAVSAGGTVYLNPGVWNSAGNPIFAMHTWQGSGSNPADTVMTAVDHTSYYSATIPAGAENVIFLRLNPTPGAETGSGWDVTLDTGVHHVWNQTSDLSFASSGSNDCYNVTDWNSGEWITHVDPDYPDSNGYYIVGTETNWKFAGAPKMGAGSGTDKAFLVYNGKAGEKFKVRSYFDGVDTWYGDDDYKVGDTDATLDVYINQYDGLWVEPHVSTFTVEVIVDGVKRGDEQVADGALPVAPAKDYGKSFSGWFDDAECTKGHEVTAIHANTKVYGKVDVAAKDNYTIDDVTGVLGSGDKYFYAFTGEDPAECNHEWPGEKIVNNTINVPVTAKIVINNNNDKQTVDIEQKASPVNNDKLVITPDVDLSGHYGYEWYSDVEKPAEQGYYVVGLEDDYGFGHAVKMTALNPEDPENPDHNSAQLLNHHFDIGDAICVRSYYEDRYPFTHWFDNGTGEVSYGGRDEDENFVFSKAGNYNIFAKYDGDYRLFYVQYVDPIELGYYLIGSFNDWSTAGNAGEIKATVNEGVYTVDLEAAANTTAKLVKFSAGMDVTFITPSSLYVDPSEAVQFPVTLDDQANVKFANGGHYRIVVRNVDDEHGAGDYEVICLDYACPYTVTVGSGDPIAMTRVEKGDLKGQYKALIPSVSAGDTVSFKNNAAAMTPAPGADATEFNNIDVTTGKIMLSGTNIEIYLKWHTDDSFSYYVSGRSAKYYVHTTSFNGMVVNPAEPEGHYMLTGLALSAGDTFDLYCVGHFAPSGENFSQEKGLGFSSNGTVVTCTKDGIYNLYLNATSFDAKLHIGGQTDADKKASEVAEYFLGLFEKSELNPDGICSADGNTNKEAISEAWTECAGKYSAVIGEDTDAQNILADSSTVGDTAYCRFAALYDTIYVKYANELTLTNFAKRSLTPNGGASIGFITNGNDFPTLTTIFVVIAATSYLAFTAIIIIKKKKSNK